MTPLRTVQLTGVSEAGGAGTAPQRLPLPPELDDPPELELDPPEGR